MDCLQLHDGAFDTNATLSCMASDTLYLCSDHNIIRKKDLAMQALDYALQVDRADSDWILPLWTRVATILHTECFSKCLDKSPSLMPIFQRLKLSAYVPMILAIEANMTAYLRRMQRIDLLTAAKQTQFHPLINSISAKPWSTGWPRNQRAPSSRASS